MVNKDNDNKIEDTVDEVDNNTLPDEQMHLFVYGNILIKDPDTGDVLVNKSF